MTAPSARDWHLLSDLHLGARGSERQSAAFVRLLDALRDQRRADRTDLVLLGDVFELYPEGLDRADVTSLGSSLDRCHTTLSGQHDVLVSLAALLREGVGVRIVPGNHDLDFHRPEIQDAFRKAITTAGAAVETDLTFHPWIYSIPGVLHAEHGHRYHVINAVPAEPILPSNEMFLPAATWAAFDDRAFAVAALAALRREGRPWFRRGSQLSAGAASTLAASMGLDPVTVQRLDRLASPTRASTVMHLVRAARRGPRHAGEYLERSAPEISAAFDATSPRPSVHAFGHTHRAALRSLSTGAVYANCGTWTEHYPRPDHDPTDRRYTWLRVRRLPSTVEVAVREWLDDRAVGLTISEATVPVRPEEAGAGASPNGDSPRVR